MLKALSIGVAAAFAAMSLSGITAAHAQSATSCPGGSDSTASDCLQIFNPDGSQLSLLAITEQDELDNPGKMWSISGVVGTNPDFVGKWIALTEPGTGAISDIVGVPTDGTLAFISDPADFSGFTLVGGTEENSSPLEITGLLGPAEQSAGFTAFFQSDLNAVPEPATWAMSMLGFAGLAFAGWRRAGKREAALA